MKKIIVLSLFVLLVAAGCKQAGAPGAKVLTLDEAKAKAVDFINTNLMQPGNSVTLQSASEEKGLYKLVVAMSSGQEVTSYMTKDGSKFFPQVIDVAEVEQQSQGDQADQEAAQAQSAADVPKAEKAKVELFVMSHCPYGTQIEKGILPVVKTLGDQVDFELKFCDYAMHPTQGEIEEQINQYCIQKNQPEKLVPYLECFLADGDGDSCLSSNSINQPQLRSCVASTEAEYKITENYENNVDFRGRFPGFGIHKAEVDKYGVSGSPTLVVNGQKVSSGRDSASLMKSICAGYENPPAECETAQLSSASPSPGFGFGTASAGSADASCE